MSPLPPSGADRLSPLPSPPGADQLSPLPRAFFARAVTEVAADLLGRVVEHQSPEGRVRVRLTEVEAYAGQRDPGSHAYRGRTARTAVMFGPAGHAYVYFSYGIHWCMNLVCDSEGTAAAVLLRAGEVIVGHQLAAKRRPACRSRRDLARGPARLTAALGIDGRYDGCDVIAVDSPLRVLAGVPISPGDVRRGPRVGVGGDGATTPWRFWADQEPTVSTYRPHAPRQRGSGRAQG